MNRAESARDLPPDACNGSWRQRSGNELLWLEARVGTVQRSVTQGSPRHGRHQALMVHRGRALKLGRKAIVRDNLRPHLGCYRERNDRSPVRQRRRIPDSLATAIDLGQVMIGVA